MNYAINADATNFEAHTLKLRLLASSNDLSAFMLALKDCNDANQYLSTSVADLPNVSTFSKNPVFMNFLETLGKNGITLQAELNTKLSVDIKKQQAAIALQKQNEQDALEHTERQTERFKECARDGSRLDSEITEDARRLDHARLMSNLGALSQSTANDIRKDHASLGRKIDAFKNRCSGSFNDVNDSEKSSICSHPAYQSAWCNKF